MFPKTVYTSRTSFFPTSVFNDGSLFVVRFMFFFPQDASQDAVRFHVESDRDCLYSRGILNLELT